MHRFYIPDFDVKSKAWIQKSDTYNQISRVLRLKSGDCIAVFNSGLTEGIYKILDIDKLEISLALINRNEHKAPAKHFYMFFSVIKKDKNEWLIQKCTELGITNFVPIISSRTIKTNLDIERLEKIITEAVEQSGRVYIPKIRNPIGFDKAIQEYKDSLVLFYAEKDKPTAKVLDSEKDLGVLIGPEGGWSPEELHYFEDAKLSPLMLNEATLRAETAAIVAASKVVAF